MILENKLNITDQAELAREEEKISKTRAKEMFEKGYLNKLEPGTFETLKKIHKYLFDKIYEFAGNIRKVNIAKGNFRFTPLTYLEESIKNIEKMPQSTYEEIIEKYVEMNIAHPFREGNGRSTRIWLNQILNTNTSKLLVIDKIDSIPKEEQLKFCELLKYRKISTFELPKNCVIIVTATTINNKKINNEILSLVAQI